MLLLVCVILVATLAILLLHNQQYSLVTANIVRASQFNQNFKEEVDLKMYYYVIDSSYGETLPLQEVDEAKALAQELLSGTQDRQSRKAITSAIDLCENLHERIVQITETDGYEARMELLESNIYILTELIQQYFYTYLYHEAGYLDSLQAALTARLWLELGLVAAGALVLVGVLMRRSAAISRSITQPIYALRERAQSIGRGDLAAREPVVAEDETLQALSSSIEQMAQHLQQQMELNRQEQAKLRAMELALLQSQINPHFLYNTLDTIIWLVETGKNEQAVEMVTSLSNFFRSSLSKGRDIITLGEEEIHVRSYLEIQQVRYRDILCYEIHVQPELRSCVLPKLTLQPLVENAIKYVEANIGRCDLSVEELSRGLGMSRVHLYKKLLQITGKTPIEFIRVIRLKRAAQMLRESQQNVSEIAYQLGFNNPKYFSKYFKDEFGVLPSVYQEREGR